MTLQLNLAADNNRPCRGWDGFPVRSRGSSPSDKPTTEEVLRVRLYDLTGNGGTARIAGHRAALVSVTSQGTCNQRETPDLEGQEGNLGVGPPHMSNGTPARNEPPSPWMYIHRLEVIEHRGRMPGARR